MLSCHRRQHVIAPAPSITWKTYRRFVAQMCRGRPNLYKSVSVNALLKRLMRPSGTVAERAILSIKPHWQSGGAPVMVPHRPAQRAVENSAPANRTKGRPAAGLKSELQWRPQFGRILPELFGLQNRFSGFQTKHGGKIQAKRELSQVLLNWGLHASCTRPTIGWS